MKSVVTKLVIPAAGMGTRFLPITKSLPKEMLPINNRPCIEYIVGEGVEAGITNMVIILSPEKQMIVDYFSHNQKLNNLLQQQNKMALLQDLNHIITRTKFEYVVQQQAQGVAHALMQAQHTLQDSDFFAMAYPDDIIFGKNPEIGYLIEQAQQHNSMIIAVMEIPKEKISSYGVIAPKKQIAPDLFEIENLVEKPSIDQAPSNLAIVGRFVLHKDLFTYIPQTTPNQQGEILLPDTIRLMIQHGYKVLAHVIKGERFDTGTPQGWTDCIIKHHNNSSKKR